VADEQVGEAVTPAPRECDSAAVAAPVAATAPVAVAVPRQP
jgi:hypothetical protein